MSIYIPTYARERVLTYEAFPPELQSKTTLVVSPNDKKQLAQRYPEAKFWITPSQGQGAAVVREAIWRKAMKSDSRTCTMVDDDLKFLWGFWKDGKKLFRSASPKQIAMAFRFLQAGATLRGCGFTTFAMTLFNNYEEKWVLNKRLHRSICINVENCKTIGATFLGIPTMEDVWFSLQAYTNGLLVEHSQLWL